MIQDIIKYRSNNPHYFDETYSSVTGADGDEESVEYESSDAAEAGGVPEADMPKFRQLVRAKKAELKAKYGKTHYVKRNESCSDAGISEAAWIARAYLSGGIGLLDHNKKCTGWRKKWKDYKKQGGLGALKIQAKSGANKGSAGYTGQIAKEGENFVVGANKVVKYGAENSFVKKTVSGSAQCTNAYFGSDPIPNTAKVCILTNEAPQKEPTPTPPPQINDGSETANSGNANQPTPTTPSNSTKYLVYGGLGLLVVGGIVFLVKKFTK
jgi:hypothetical protein